MLQLDCLVRRRGGPAPIFETGQCRQRHDSRRETVTTEPVGQPCRGRDDQDHRCDRHDSNPSSKHGRRLRLRALNVCFREARGLRRRQIRNLPNEAVTPPRDCLDIAVRTLVVAQCLAEERDRVERLASSTKVSGHTCLSRSSLVTRCPAHRISAASKSNAFGGSATGRPARRSWCSAGSNRNGPNT